MARWRSVLAVMAAAGVLMAFAFGLWRVFAVRFGAGDVHPPYSTFNTGPTGARAVFDAFSRLGRPVTTRNLLPLSRFRDADGATLVLAGAGAEVFGEDTVENFEAIESLMRDGLRLVVALNARSVPWDGRSTAPTFNPWRGVPGWPPTGGAVTPGEEPLRSAGERWGFQFEAAMDPERAPNDGFEVAPAGDGPSSAPRWFSVWRWAELHADWMPLATVAGRPVMIRRSFGQGSLTVLSDTVFLSNEALWRAPEPGFLLWLLAQEPRLVFDETLHGTLSSPGVMHLMRRYRLLGFFGGAAVLLGLFAWRAGTSLVPVHASVAEAVDHPLTGAAGASGFSNLLRQTIPPKQLLRACFTEWAKSPFVRRQVSAATVAAVRDIVVAAEKDPRSRPAATWRTIAELLATTRRGSG